MKEKLKLDGRGVEEVTFRIRPTYQDATINKVYAFPRLRLWELVGFVFAVLLWSMRSC